MPSEDSERSLLQPDSTSPDTHVQQEHTPQGEHQPSPALPPTLFTEQGRLALYWHWAGPRFADGRLERGKSYTQREKAALFADWLRTLVTDGKLDPRKRLPAYRMFADPPTP
jgi:hypothetical protein